VPNEIPARTQSNPYVAAALLTEPDEIVEYELASNPYANMLPGIANINAARAVANGVRVGRRGHRGLRLVSLGLLLVLLAPAVAAAVANFFR